LLRIIGRGCFLYEQWEDPLRLRALTDEGRIASAVLFAASRFEDGFMVASMRARVVATEK
jgi:hypothetical protein